MKPKVIVLGAFSCALFFSQCSEKAILSEELVGISYRAIRPDSVIADEIFISIDEKNQAFLVDPVQDTVLQCRKGTKVFLPRDLMCFKDGTTPERRVKVIVEECYDAASFICNNLTTSCGDRLLESGGSVHISASSEGRELVVKDGMDFEIAFPKTGGKGGMEIFYGEEGDGGAVTWTKPQEQVEGLNREKRKADSTEVSFNGKPVITTYTIPLRSNRFLKFIDQKGDTIDFRDYFAENFTPGKEFMEYSKGQESWQLPLCFSLDTVTGKLKDFLIRNSGFPKQARIELLTFLQKMPPICVDMKGPYTGWTESRKRWLSDDVLGKNARFEMSIVLMDSLYDRRKELKRMGYTEEQYSAYVERQDAYNVLYSQGFGWINCDRFINRNLELVNYIIPVSAENGEVRLFFKDGRIALRSGVINGKAEFSNIPKGMDVVVMYMNFEVENPEYLFLQYNTSKPPAKIDSAKIFIRDKWEEELKAMVRDMPSSGAW